MHKSLPGETLPITWIWFAYLKFSSCLLMMENRDIIQTWRDYIFEKHMHQQSLILHSECMIYTYIAILFTGFTGEISAFINYTTLEKIFSPSECFNPFCSFPPIKNRLGKTTELWICGLGHTRIIRQVFFSWLKMNDEFWSYPKEIIHFLFL